MNLIIFDIDGTLTNTNEVDAKYFSQTMKEHLQIKSINTNWSSYRYSTDSGILKEIFEILHQRDPLPEEINKIRNCFVNYIKQDLENKSLCIHAIPGAQNIFAKIIATSHWHIGIATGGWKHSALLKMECAQIPHMDIPKAFADDHIERTEIIQMVIKKAQQLHSVSNYERTIYVGDGIWDYHAASQLQIEFIGLGDRFAKLEKKPFFIQDYEAGELLDFLTK